MKKLILLFSLALIFASTFVFAQVEQRLQFSDEELRNELHWIELMQQENPNFFEVKRAYDLYFETHEKVKGSGYKQFERWAWLVEGDVQPDGSLPEPDAVFNAYQAYKKEQELKGPGTNPGDWTEIGPMTYPTNGTGQETGTGRVNALAFHPTDPNKFWIGAPSGGLWVTTDGGQTYSSNTDQMPTLGVSSILVDPGTPNTMYLGSGDRDAGNAPGLGIFKSTDGGATWTLSNTGMGSYTVGMMEFYPGNSSIIIAATSGGIFRTTDSGANWTLVSSNPSNYKDIKIHPTDPNYMYATASGSFFRSTDGGLNWSQITSGLVSCGRMVLGVSADQPDAVLCLLTGGSQIFQGIFKSTDKGLNFTRITSAAHPNILGYNDGDGSTQATYDLCMLVNPNDVDSILVGSINIHLSVDGGTNFSKQTHWSTQLHADQHTVARNPLNGRIYEGHDGGLHYSDDYFDTYTNISSGLNIAQAYKIGQAAQTRELVVNGYQDNGTGLYDAGTFTTITGGDGMECLIDYANESYAYATYISEIKRSNSGGYGGWSLIAKDGVNGIDESGAWVTPYMLHETDPNTMFFGYKNIWRSNNVRNSPPTWVKISNNLGGSNSSNYRVLAHSSANNDVFYGARSDNNLFRSDNVNDATPTWTDLTSLLPSGSAYIADVTCHPTDPEIVYLIQSDKVYKSLDKGNSWTDISGTLPAVSLKCIVYDKYSDEGIYIGTKTGVFFKNADMADWILYDGDLPVVDVRELEIYYGGTDSRLRAATYGRGLWETPLYHDPTAAPVANFETNVTTCNVNDTVDFTDLSANGPTSWAWTISPAGYTYANGTTASSQHPQVKFTSTGVYTVSLIATNANGSDTKTINSYISVYSVVAPNCTPITQNLANYYMGIYRVQFNTIDNASGQPHQDNPASGYMDFINSNNTSVAAGQSYNLTVELGTGYTEWWNVYIDFNNDGDFVDTDEEVYVAPAKVSGEHTISISIPATPPAVDQLLRMRILCDLNPISGPCDDPGYGQAEDYGLIIQDLPLLTTTTVSSIGSDAAQSGGIITDQGGSVVSSRGVVWGFYTNPSLDNNLGYTENGTGTGSFVSSLTGLQAKQTYYLRAYATNSSGISYGQNESFTTLTETPVLSTDDISSISYYTATSGGNITSDGGQAITSKGVIWDTVPGTSLGKSVGMTTDGTGAGTFVSSIIGLEPDKTYYVKAYARNSYSIAYGTEKSFTTLPPDANQSRDISFNNVTTDKMDVFWTNGTGANRVVKINTENSFTPPADGTDPTAITVYGGGEQIIYNGTGSTVTVTNLAPSTVYYYVVYDYNGSGAGTVYNTAPGIDNPDFSSTYCLPSYTTGDVGTHIKRFICNTIDNTSSQSHYSDYTNISTDLVPGETYDVSFEMSYNQENLHLWIDMNNDQEFDASEQLLANFFCPANVLSTTQITVPASSENGNRLMRVRSSWNSGAGPCSTQTYGEVEDYTVNLSSSITWTGAVSTDWSNAGNWSTGVPLSTTKASIPSAPTNQPHITAAAASPSICKDLTIDVGSVVTIDPGKALTVSGILTNNAGSDGLILKADATGISSLLHNTINVNAKVESYITQDQWHFISSPVSNAVSNVFLGVYLKYFVESDSSWNYITELNQPLTPGQGYAAWSVGGSTGNYTANYIGLLNNGNLSPIINYTSAATHGGKGWNMIGNPFPSALEWTNGWSQNNLDYTTYVYDGAQYLTWNHNNGGAPFGTKGNGDIPAGQAFWVKANNTGASLTIPQSERKHSTQAFYKTSNEIFGLISFIADGNGYTDKAIIYFNEDATSGFDSNYDAWKIKGKSIAPQIYSYSGTSELSVNTLPFVDENMLIPFGFEVGVEDIYSITVSDLENLENGIEVYLEDLKENNMIDLRQVSSYTFYASPDDVVNRFLLHFNNTTFGAEENAIHDFNIYSYDKDVYVIVPEFTSGDIVIYNMMGQEITSTSINNATNKITIEKSGYYLVTIISDEAIVTEKVFIR